MNNHIKRIRKVLAKNAALRKGYHAVKRLRIRAYQKKHNLLSYEEWIEQCEPHLWSEVSSSASQPLISIVVPTFNTPDKYLKPLLESVRAQTYPHWQLCVADGSPMPHAPQP
jgi:cellulose synthase/poly-beta-1,6-N-acetylglucosamine synthase-like glycosyltransferase